MDKQYLFIMNAHHVNVCMIILNLNLRLIRTDPKTKKSEVLLNGLHFANGVQLSKDEEFVIVSESVRSRVMK